MRGKRPRKLYLWLLADVVLLMGFRLMRENRDWMNGWEQQVAASLRRFAGRLCAGTEVSMMEVLGVLLVLGSVGYLLWSVWAIRAAAGRRRARAYSAVLGALCIGLTIDVGFSYLWGVTFWVDSFQDRSGIHAQMVEERDLKAVTLFFADQLAETAGQVERDENGLFAVSREEILAASSSVYDEVEEMFPFLEFEDLPVKEMAFSRLMSRLNFTGFYCPWTGESNVNADSPACLLPATTAHELAHRRGIASEQECNFLAVLASTTSGNPAYEYAGWLKGFIHLGNALYAADPEAYREIRDGLPETVKQDLAYNNAYWKQFRGSVVQRVSTTLYDGMLKAYGDERGVQSYGMVVDLLVVYYRERAAALLPSSAEGGLSQTAP